MSIKYGNKHHIWKLYKNKQDVLYNKIPTVNTIGILLMI